MVHIVDHSIQYDFSEMPATRIGASMIWQLLYLTSVTGPFLLLSDRRLRLLGFSVAVAAAVTQIHFRYAFILVWCFFASWLSLHICYVLYHLPEHTKHPNGPCPAEIAVS